MEDGDLSEKVQEEEEGVTSSRAQDIKNAQTRGQTGQNSRVKSHYDVTKDYAGCNSRIHIVIMTTFQTNRVQ